MVWGVEEDTVKKELLSPLGLICYGGKIGMREYHIEYHIISKFNSFDIYLSEKN